jgi:hypothetical protein
VTNEPGNGWLILKLDALHTAIRYIRDQFGDDKCYEDWHKLFAMLPEGFTPPKQDIAVQLEHCERFLKCRAAGINYVPPPRWVVGTPDKDGMWLVVMNDGWKYVMHHREGSAKPKAFDEIVKCFGPMPEAP